MTGLLSSEGKSPSAMRVAFLVQIAVACYMAVYAVMSNMVTPELIGLITLFLGNATAGKVAQKKVEK